MTSNAEWINNKTILINKINSLKTAGSWNLNYELWEKNLIQNIYDYFKNIDKFIFIDIGSNVGSYTLLTKEFKDSFCIAFEANNYIYDILKKNIELNNVTDKTLLNNIALSNKEEEKILKIPNDNRCGSGLSCLCDKPIRYSNFTTQKINTITLDSYINNINTDKIDFIKIDTEGWEYFILLGAINTIKKYKPIIQLEIWDENIKQCNINKDDIFNLLKDLNYNYKFISHEDIWCEPIK